MMLRIQKRASDRASKLDLNASYVGRYQLTEERLAALCASWHS